MADWEFEMRLLVNPSHDELIHLFNNATDGNVRALRAPDGKIYAWAAHDARHVEVATALNLLFKTRPQLQAASYLLSWSDVETAGNFGNFDDLIERISNNNHQ